MSLLRTVYLGAILCGWLAFGGWFAAEVLRQGVSRPESAPASDDPAENTPRFLGSTTLGSMLESEKAQTIAAFCVVGAAIGAGLGLAGGLSNWRLGPQVLRMLRGFVAGGLGGYSGGWLGAMIYQTFSTANEDAAGAETHWWLRPAGWMAAGALVGLADGLLALSPNRMRNGLIGGVAGGLIGGMLFDPIQTLVAQTAGAGDPTLQFEITSRAAGFVAVGLCIGGAVGLTHLLLRHAWLTVLDGDRPGRQVILSGTRLTLGSDPGAGLPFLRDADRTLLPFHVSIVRGRDGSFSLLPASPGADADVTVVKDGNRRTVSLRNQDANGISLENDCVITCGRNSIRFNEKSHRSETVGRGASTVIPTPPRPNLASESPPLKPAWPNQPQRPAPPVPAPPPVPQPRSTSPPAKPSERGASPSPPQPISQPERAQPVPAPIKSHQPPPTPRIAPLPVSPPLPQPQPSTRAENLCPNGHKVPTGQGYCVVCDTYF